MANPAKPIHEYRGIVYFKSKQEQTYAKARAAKLNRTLSSYIRDLVIADLLHSGTYYPNPPRELLEGEEAPPATPNQGYLIPNHGELPPSLPPPSIPSVMDIRDMPEATNVVDDDMKDLLNRKE